jgi:GxxExxY protein
MDLLHRELTDRIIKCFYEVYNTLGYGFLEKVYERAMMIELKKNGLPASNQQAIEVYYKTELVGSFSADIIVDDVVILELKAASAMVAENELQLVNYLRSTSIEIGLLCNFGRKPEVRRKIFTNDHKHTQNK